jgi:hypothetical protein
MSVKTQSRTTLAPVIMSAVSGRPDAGPFSPPLPLVTPNGHFALPGRLGQIYSAMRLLGSRHLCDRPVIQGEVNDE